MEALIAILEVIKLGEEITIELLRKADPSDVSAIIHAHVERDAWWRARLQPIIDKLFPATVN